MIITKESIYNHLINEFNKNGFSILITKIYKNVLPFQKVLAQDESNKIYKFIVNKSNNISFEKLEEISKDNKLVIRIIKRINNTSSYIADEIVKRYFDNKLELEVDDNINVIEYITQNFVTANDYDKFNIALEQDLYFDDIYNFIKNKVVNVIVSEKANHIKVDEENKNIENILNENKNNYQKMMSIYLKETISPIKHISLFNTIQQIAIKCLLINKPETVKESIDIERLLYILQELNISLFDNSIELNIRICNSINQLNNYEKNIKLFEENTEMFIDKATTDAIIIYTFLEILYSLNILQFKSNDVKNIINTNTDNIDTFVYKNLNSINRYILSELKEIVFNNSINTKNINELKCISTELISFINSTKLINDELKHTYMIILNKLEELLNENTIYERNVIDNIEPDEKPVLLEYKVNNDLIQLKRAINIINSVTTAKKLKLNAIDTSNNLFEAVWYNDYDAVVYRSFISFSDYNKMDTKYISELIKRYIDEVGENTKINEFEYVYFDKYAKKNLEVLKLH